MYCKYIKRVMDFVLSFLALLVLSPLMGGIALSIRLKMGKQVIFKQERPGLNEKIFTLYKFRTMTNQKNEKGEALPDEARLTRFGAFLRSTSLDELPELFNILIGEMSLIGPRPLLIKDMVFMSGEQRRRHSVLPGLSGLAQINGRNCIYWEDKLTYDIQYIKKITFLGDLRILAATVVKVFKREGISTEGMSTAEDYGDYLLRIGKIGETEYLERLDTMRQFEPRPSAAPEPIAR